MEGDDGLMNIFLESSIEALVEQGFGNKVDEMLSSLKIENKALISKVNKLLNKVENGDSSTRIRKYFKKVQQQGNKALKNTNNLLQQKAKDAVAEGIISKEANQIRKGKQKENDQ
ncbi:hypothetical protein [Flavobacterium piscisymbiosum]|uniref:Uncharacterized protein n=1 Tax=Flavobacterium piscisymbiosum TaxID=2893753 RepID=A0ABS8MKC6_9FLAO|nr:hypothetical protein [Flavobacterium sp. F-30]MCC9065946.1 hypothetical protein [Flavobacterium sp. F-30]